MKYKIYIMLCVVFLFQFLTGCQKDPLVEVSNQTSALTTEAQTEENIAQTTDNVTTEIHSAQIMVKVYLGNLDEDKLFYKEKEFAMNEKENLETFFTKILKKEIVETENLVKAIPNDATIQKIEVKEDKAYVDMSKDYPNMNYGSTGEWLALQSLANTIGDYYGVTEVVVTVDGDPYSSGHILYEVGEGIKVIKEVEKIE